MTASERHQAAVGDCALWQSRQQFWIFKIQSQWLFPPLSILNLQLGTPNQIPIPPAPALQGAGPAPPVSLFGNPL